MIQATSLLWVHARFAALCQPQAINVTALALDLARFLWQP